MAKLVLLSQGLIGRTHELKVDKTTIGRVDDNTFPIVEASVSSHHCEILLQGADVLVRDLNSTNGTFINGEKITEAALRPGQVLRLGQIEMRLETEAAAAPGKSSPTPDNTTVIQRGVSLTDLEAGAQRNFDKANTGFSKKENKGNKIFFLVAIVVGVLIVGLLIYTFATMK